MAIPPPGRFDAEKLRRTRVAAGLSRPELAERIGADASIVKSWETRGVRPTVSNLSRVADALGLSVGDLYQPDATTEGSLADLRIAAGLNQRELAQQLGVSQSSVTRWEGGRARPTWEEITHYAAALGVTRIELADAIDTTAQQHGNPSVRQKDPGPNDFHLTPSSPHVIYEFENPSGHVTVTSPQFPRLVFRPKSETPTMRELATICEHVEADYRHRYNHLQHRCAGDTPADPVYLIRWLSIAHDTPPGSTCPRTRSAASLGLAVPSWRSGQAPGPRHQLSTGEYLVIVVEPGDTAEFLFNQIPPDEEVTFFPTQLDDDLGPLAITRDRRPDGIARSQIPPDMPYSKLFQHLSPETATPVVVVAPDTPQQTSDFDSIPERFNQSSPHDPPLSDKTSTSR